MGTEQGTRMSSETAASSLPPELYLRRARTRGGRDSLLAPSTPPTRNHVVTVPFLWEDTPGKPKTPGSAPAASTTGPVLGGGGATAMADHGVLQEDARTVPLKLPPRLQTAEYLLSPRTVLQGPYCGVRGGRRPPRPLRRSDGGAAGFRTKLGAAGELFYWRKAAAGATGSRKKEGADHDAADSDASCCSPARSFSSSSSSSSMSYFFDDHSRGGAHWRRADGREDSGNVDVGDDGTNGSVRIRRIKSLPSMNTSHLLASIRRGVRQISPRN